VIDSLESADVLLLLVDATESFGSGDQFVFDMVKEQQRCTFLLLNKTDIVRKEKLLPLIAKYSQAYTFAEVLPVSALKKDNLDLLLDLILKYLPEGPAYYPEDQYTDRPERFLVGEIVREKVLRQTEEELPYATTVLVNRFEDKPEVAVIHCDIYVERASQKKIVIGSQGSRLKQIGTQARLEIESLLQKRVFLELYVKVQPKWRDDGRFLDTMNIGELGEG
jgi:GTP-binding protein Era